ncbi:MFS transporter, partial [Streptococcus pyogenes]
AKDTSNALALMGVGAMSAGLLFGRNMQLFKEWLLPIAFSGLSLSLFLLANSRQVWMVLVLNFFIGLCFRTFMPFLLNKANQSSDGGGEKRTA